MQHRKIIAINKTIEDCPRNINCTCIILKTNTKKEIIINFSYSRDQIRKVIKLLKQKRRKTGGIWRDKANKRDHRRQKHPPSRPQAPLSKQTAGPRNEWKLLV